MRFAAIISGLRLRLNTYRSACQWVGLLNHPPSASGRVLITALRNPTWIEWAAYCAAVIRQYGYESTLIYKGSEVRRIYGPKLFNFWEKIKSLPGIQFIDLEGLPYSEDDYRTYYDDSLVSSVAALAYDHHIESEDIINNPEKFEGSLIALRIEASTNAARVSRHFESSKYHQFICYSGIIWDTPSILKAAINSGQEVVCVEGWAWRPGHMIYNFGAPALEYNVEGWINHFGNWDSNKESEIRKYFNFLDGDAPTDNWLKNFYPVQLAKKTESLPSEIADFLEGESKVFLLACNVIGDSSLLNRETIFKSHKDFVAKTIEFFRERPDLKLIIRAHPAEEWVKSKVTIKLGEFSSELAKGISNIHVIDSSEKINTFTLIPYIHFGLVWLSSIGVDLVVRGIPVIAAAKPKYFGLNIVEEPDSIETFFSKIEEFAGSSIKVTPSQIQAAKEYLYVVFKGFSFEAQGRTYRADSCKMITMPQQEEHDQFYKILLKLIPAPDRDLSRA